HGQGSRTKVNTFQVIASVIIEMAKQVRPQVRNSVSRRGIWPVGMIGTHLADFIMVRAQSRP
ncbi:TPA: hypothetical protein ACGBIE_003254, partial [Yersinia enterocolitica]